MLAVGAGGHHSGHIEFRRGAAPEKIIIVRTGGGNSGGISEGWLAGVRFLGVFGALYILDILDRLRFRSRAAARLF